MLIITLTQDLQAMGGATAGDEGDASPAIIPIFNIRPMDVAWKESTSNGPRPPQSSRRGDARGYTYGTCTVSPKLRLTSKICLLPGQVSA